MEYKNKEEAQAALDKLKASINTAKEQAMRIEAIVNSFDSSEYKLGLMEKRFIELMNGLTIKLVDNGIIYYIGEDWIVNQDVKNKIVYFSYYRFWSFFEKEFELKFDDIQSFTTDMVKKHLNCEGFTTAARSEQCDDVVKKHLNCEGFTTNL